MSATGDAVLPDVLRHSPVEVAFGPGRLSELGGQAGSRGAQRVLLVTDPGIVAAGYVRRGADSLRASGLEVTVFDEVIENPTTLQVAAGLERARDAGIDFIVAIGGGSAMDCAKGINLLLTNGGQIRDYWGVDKAEPRMLPLITVPTTAGTGSEAQSFALISDPDTHRKMACGVRALPGEGGLRPVLTILDPDLTASQPADVARAVGIDAIAHTVETAGCNARTDVSREFSRQAWQRLLRAYPRSLLNGADESTRADMLLGAHLAGAAIEQSMLGAAHACANPLTARFGVTHGIAVGLMLPHVVAFNCTSGTNPYADLEAGANALITRLNGFLEQAGLPRRLSDLDVPAGALPELAAMAAQEWTARFNPRAVHGQDLLEVYEQAS